jgi:hypothetical protein
MTPVDELRSRVRKLSSRAMQAKMDLHDLSEELPLRWEEIPDVAVRTHALYAELTAAQQ